MTHLHRHARLRKTRAAAGCRERRHGRGDQGWADGGTRSRAQRSGWSDRAPSAGARREVACSPWPSHWRGPEQLEAQCLHTCFGCNGFGADATRRHQSRSSAALTARLSCTQAVPQHTRDAIAEAVARCPTCALALQPTQARRQLGALLATYAAIDPSVGYRRGLNHVAGLVLLYSGGPDEALPALRLLLQRWGLRSLYLPDGDNLQARARRRHYGPAAGRWGVRRGVLAGLTRLTGGGEGALRMEQA